MLTHIFRSDIVAIEVGLKDVWAILVSCLVCDKKTIKIGLFCVFLPLFSIYDRYRFSSQMPLLCE